MPRISLRRTFTAALLLLSMLLQLSAARAGTTGGLQGIVLDSQTGAPVAAARVTVSSPSQNASVITDAGGHYHFLALAPDTYTVSVTKDGYDDVSHAGVSIFADNVSTFDTRLTPALKTIAKVTSRAAGALVKPGVTTDTYDINAVSTAKAAALGGGGNLDMAYSAMASVPGITVPTGGAGWGQATYIRGSQSFFAGFEFDGVPVNRAFDNYNASTESTLGLQELQVYTGGGPASSSSAGTSGFINQVIKTGTYPGFASFAGTIGTPSFLHSAKIEAGGASPNRNFSYYVGFSGSNAAPRMYDNANGVTLAKPNGVFGYAASYFPTNMLAEDGLIGGVPLCNSDGTTPSSMSGLPWYSANGWTGVPDLSGSTCLYSLPASFNLVAGGTFGTAALSDRENVVNLHFGLPRKDGQRDDLQLLWSASSLQTTFYSSANDMGGANGSNLNPVMLAVTGLPYCPLSGVGPNCASLGFSNYPQYVDGPATYNLAFGTPIVTNGGTGVLPTLTYYQPSSPQNRLAQSPLPNDLRDTVWNDTGVVKAQWTHPLSSNAFVRLFGYTFFSDWTQAGAAGAWSDYDWGIGGPTDGAVAANYDLITHTSGGQFQFVDQLTAKHLLNFTANYTTANTMRFNNYNYIFQSFFGGGSPIGLISVDSTGIYHCWDPLTGVEEPTGCKPNGKIPGNPSWNQYGPNPVANPVNGLFTAPPGSPAAAAGAQWVTLWNGDASGPRNTVKPNFAFVSFNDEWRPTDRLVLNLGLRFDSYVYNLSKSPPGTSFYAGIVKNNICVNSAGTYYATPLVPGQPPPAPPIYTTTCPAGYSHPNFSANSPSQYSITDWSPRFSMTYTQTPDTVWRASIGRFTEPPISASVQYLGAAGDARSTWIAGLPIGFRSPFHPIPAMSATQADLSLEHQLHGTDMSFRISPFYNYTTGYQQQAFIGPNFVTQAPVGAFRSYGAEFAFNKGDFLRNGLSGTLAVTLTDAKTKYESRWFGTNQIATANGTIAQFNSLTSACGSNTAPAGVTPGSIYNGCIAGETPASPCYSGGAPVSCSTAGAIANPYYNMAKQPLLDPSGWYPSGDTGLDPVNNTWTTYFDTPLTTALILNYRHNKFAITPSFQFVGGSSYGGPMDVMGVDPRACGANSVTDGITAVSPSTNPLQCDYLSQTGGNGATFAKSADLFIPNPQTGSFAKPGQFRSPNLFLMNIMLSYDISPKITAQLTLADIYHTCFGGSSEPWTKAYAPGANVCSYQPGTFYYISNAYNGTGPNDVAANGFKPYPWQVQSYVPQPYGSDASYVPMPFNAYFQLNIKI